jgi:hypothetical protein
MSSRGARKPRKPPLPLAFKTQPCDGRLSSSTDGGAPAAHAPAVRTHCTAEYTMHGILGSYTMHGILGSCLCRARACMYMRVPNGGCVQARRPPSASPARSQSPKRRGVSEQAGFAFNV